MKARDFALIAQESYSAAPDIGLADSASRAILRDTLAGLVVAFPGSNDLACWKADFNFIPQNVPGLGCVHRGFWDAWKEIEIEVWTAIAGRPVTFVGHSLGAAIAILAGAASTVAGNPSEAIYGFEPPRVSFDLSIRTVLAQEQVNLYKNGNDIVPDLPFGGYHPAILNKIGKPLLPIPNVRDHMMGQVLLALPA
jgi:hypothetical protein